MPSQEDQFKESAKKQEIVEERVAPEKVETASEGDDAETGNNAEESSIESLQAQLEQASAEVTKFKDVALRAEAEMQNVRRRATIDLENAHKYGLEKFIQNVLPVADGLEKALESAEQASKEGGYEAITEGIGICQKMMLDVLNKTGVEIIDPMGEPFDPNLHQAMSMIENPDVEPNSVVAVVQKGFSLNGRLVRAAMVMVSKGSSPKIDETA